MSIEANRPSAAHERTGFAQANSFITPMVFSFLGPEGRATMASVNRAYARAAWNPALSPTTKPGERQSTANALELAHLQDSLGNRHLTNLEEARKKYVLVRKFTCLDATVKPETFIRAAPHTDLGVESVKLSSLDEGSFWTRIKNKIFFYSGYEHILACQSFTKKFNEFNNKRHENFRSDLRGLLEYRDWRVTIQTTGQMHTRINRAVQKSALQLTEETNKLNYLARLFWRIVQQIVNYFYLIIPPITYYTRVSYQFPSSQGVTIGSIPHHDSTLKVQAQPFFTVQHPTGAVRFRISKDASTEVSCLVQRVWTDGSSGAVISEDNVTEQHRRKLKDRRLLVTEINSITSIDKSLRKLATSREIGEALIQNKAFMKAMKALAEELIKEREKEAKGIVVKRAAAPETLPTGYAAVLFQLIAGIFDQSSEQCLELAMPDPVTEAITTIRIRKDEDPRIRIFNAEEKGVRWGLLRDSARNLRIFREGRPLMPSFFTFDLSRYAAPSE